MNHDMGHGTVTLKREKGFMILTKWAILTCLSRLGKSSLPRGGRMVVVSGNLGAGGKKYSLET